MSQLKDGIINVDTERGDVFEFKSSVFLDRSYLWKKGNVIYISMVIIKPKHQGKGYLTKLMNSIEQHGFIIKVPVPLWKMKAILIKKGYKESDEYSEVANCKIEIWSK